MKKIIKEFLFRKWYWYISRTDKNADILFMNYGYHYDNEQINLSEADEKNRFSIQLYHKLASFADLSGKNICEIGCGRGGGLSYIHKNFKPLNSLGLDLNQRAVDFCNGHYKQDGLSFIQGDAQALPFGNDRFDVVINTESSHRYPLFNKFLSEVYRTLKTGGYLLFTDFRYDYDCDKFMNDIDRSGLEIIHKELITPQVVNALRADDSRRRELVRKLIPRLLQKTALNFAGAVDSETYNRFKEGRYKYYIFILKK